MNESMVKTSTDALHRPVLTSSNAKCSTAFLQPTV